VHHSSQPGYSISLSEAAGSSASCWSLFLQSSVLIVPEEGAMANFLLLSRSPLTGRPYSRSRQSTRHSGAWSRSSPSCTTGSEAASRREGMMWRAGEKMLMDFCSDTI
jgi:hypothetical protein